MDWEVSIAGQVFKGTGNQVIVNWDTKDARGRYVEPGSYPVIVSTSALVYDITSSSLVLINDKKTIDIYVRGSGSRYGYGWTFNHDNRLIFQNDSNGETNIIWSTDELGRTISFSKGNDANYIPSSGTYSKLDVIVNAGNAREYVITDKNMVRHAYNEKGLLVSSIDRLGNARTFTYSGDRISSISDSSGQMTIFHYNNLGSIESIKDHFGRIYQFEVNNEGYLVSVIDPLNHKTSYEYSDTGHLAKNTDARGRSTSYWTNFEGSVLARKGPDGSFRYYEMEHDLLISPDAGVLSKQLVASDSDIWFLSANLRGRSGIDNTFICDRFLSRVNKYSGEKKNYPAGEFAINGIDGNKPMYSWFQSSIGNIALNRNDGRIYVTTPRQGISVFNIGNEVFEESYLPGSDDYYFGSRSLLIDENRNYMWSLDGGLKRYSINNGKISNIYTNAHGGINNTAIDRHGNIWMADNDGLLECIAPSGEVFSSTSFAPFKFKALSAKKDSDYVYFVLSYANGVGATYIGKLDLSTGMTSYSPDTPLSRTKDKQIVIENDGMVWIEDGLDESIYYLCDPVTGSTKKYDLSKTYLSHDVYASSGLFSGNPSYLKSFIDGDNKIWFSGSSYIYGLGNAHNPDVSRFIDSNENASNYLSFLPEADSLGAVRRPSLTIDANGATTSFETNADLEISRQIDARGDIYNYVYNSSGGLSQIVQRGASDEEGLFVSIVRDPVYNKELSREIKNSSVSRKFEYRYDAKGNLIEELMPEGVKLQYSYDSRGLVMTSTDPNGRITRYSYNQNGTVSTVTRPDSKVIRYQYDAYGNVVQVMDANNHVLRFTYDVLNRKTSETSVLENGAEETTEYFYEEGPSCGCLGTVEQVASIKDAKGRITLFHYDANHHLKKVEHPDGATEQWEYDGENNLQSYTDAKGHETTFGYDPTNRLILMNDPNNREINYEYDLAGNRTAVIDPSGNRTEFTYGPFNRLAAQADARGARSEFGYDLLGNLTSLKDPLGQITRRSYDLLDRLVSEANPANHATTYAYDLAGNLARKTDAKGQETTFEYDTLNRLTRKVTPDDTTNFTFDAMGNVLSASNKNGEQRFTYDALNRILTKQEAASGRTLRYAYDKMGNISSLIDAEGKATEYRYDTRDRLSSLTFDPEGKNLAFSLQYDPAGYRTKLLRPNGVATDYAYDQAGQLLSVVSKQTSTSQVLQDLHYTYDDNGNRVQKTDTNGTVNYQYDATNQLIQEARPDQSTSWEYDLAGNRMSEMGSGAKVYTYEVPNRLQSISDGSAFGYDLNGNTTTETKGGVSTHYTYNADDRLEQIDRAGQTWKYRYDSFGTRIKKVEPSAQVSHLLNDGDDLLAEYDGSGNMLARNVFAGLDEPLARIDALGNVRYYLADALGSVTGLMNPGASLTDSYVYDAWGKIISRTGNTVQPFNFTGREDDGGALYNNRARYYAPSLGRFTQKDPLGLRSGDFNSYRYVLNRPTKNLDPLGESAITAAGPGAAAAALADGPLPGPGDVVAAAILGTAIIYDVYSQMAQHGNDKTKGLEKQVEKHQKKLDDYLKNPDAHDNKGFLGKAKDAADRERLINERKKSLENQIDNFKKQIKKIKDSLGKNETEGGGACER